MKLIPLEELHKQDLSLYQLHAVALRPVNLIYRQPPEGRRYNLLMLVEEGTCCFEYGEKQLAIGPGMILYLPQGDMRIIAGWLKISAISELGFGFGMKRARISAARKNPCFCRKQRMNRRWLFAGNCRKRFYPIRSGHTAFYIS